MPRRSDPGEGLTVVAYDVGDDRRRARLATVLEDHGVRVQFSLFECALGTRDLAVLRQAVAAILDPGADRVAYYRLCARCAAVASSSAGN